MQKKLEKLLRYHRQHIFDEKTGDAHTRALVRLKKTKTFQNMCRANADAACQRASDRLLSLYA